MEENRFKAAQMIYGADYNPDQWTGDQGIIDEDFRLMKLAGTNSASVGIFAWKKLEPQEGCYDFAWLDDIMDRMAKEGKKVILAAPSGARPAWLDQKYPEVLRVSWDRVKNLHGERHNHCYTSPYYRKKTLEMNTLLAKRYGMHPALYMWHVGNEYGGECHCALCQNAFRDWLKEKYHNNIEELNQAWWTSFWSHGFSDFSEIESPAAQGEHSLHGLNLDWHRFVTAQTVDFFRNESKPFCELTPQIPITTNLMGMYKGHNPWKIAPYMDLVSWDAYPEWGRNPENEIEVAYETAFSHDVFRSLKKQPFYLMESTPSVVNWREVNKLKKPGMNELASIQAVGHGADSIQYFQWRKSRGASEKFHGAVVDHYGKENTRVFQEVAHLGSVLKKLDKVAGTNTVTKAAVVYDWENFWAIENLQGWRKPRLYDETVLEHYKALRKLGLNVAIIDEEESLEDYSLVAAPMLYMLRGKMAERLKAYVAKGGCLVLTYASGQVDENDLCFLGGFPGGGLKDVTGIWAEELDTLYDTERNGLKVRTLLPGGKMDYEADSYCEIIHPQKGCEVLAEYTKDFYAGTPALTKNHYEEGLCYYLAARGEQKLLDDLYRQIVTERKLPDTFLDLPEGVDVSTRSDNEKAYLFLVNFSGKSQTVKLPKDSVYHDVLTGICAQETVLLEADGYSILEKV